jgi:hypothetical protein
VAEIWIRAIFFHFIEEFSNFEAALYFTTFNFTTVSYGDLVLSEAWRLMGALETADGMMLFGWSTAFIFEVVRRSYRRLYQVYATVLEATEQSASAGFTNYSRLAM